MASAGRPGLGRSAVAAGSGIAALVLLIVALVAGGGRPPATTVAPATAGGGHAVDPRVVVTTVPVDTAPALAVATLAPFTCDPAAGAPTTLLCPTSPPPELATTAVSTRPTVVIPTSGIRSPTTPPPPPTSTTSSTPGDPTRPAGITVDVRLAGTTFVAGQPVQATVRIRNATSQAFKVFVGCGVTWVEPRDASGTDITDRTGAEPCGTPGHYFNPSVVPAGGQLERVLPLAVSSSAPAGPAQARAAWARDTGPGLIHYIEATPVPVQVAAATAG